MSTPGANNLALAWGLIGRETVTYKQATGTATTADGLLVTAYAEGVTLQASVRPVPKTKYEAMGLDLQKSYVTIYTTTPAGPVTRDYAGDVMIYRARAYKIMSATDWYGQDGWLEAVCIDQGAE